MTAISTTQPMGGAGLKVTSADVTLDWAVVSHVLELGVKAFYSANGGGVFSLDKC